MHESRSRAGERWFGVVLALALAFGAAGCGVKGCGATGCAVQYGVNVLFSMRCVNGEKPICQSETPLTWTTRQETKVPLGS